MVTVTGSPLLNAAPEQPALRLDEEPAAAPIRRAQRRKGPEEEPSRVRQAAKRPDPSVDRAEKGEFGTAYRNRGKRPAGSD